MMNINHILPRIINAIIDFYIMYYNKICNVNIVIKHRNELYIDMYNRIYNEYVNMFESEDVYSVDILYESNPDHETYNKLSDDINILETLATYVDDLIYFNIPFSPFNVIITLNSEIPFELGLNISFEWINAILDIYT